MSCNSKNKNVHKGLWVEERGERERWIVERREKEQGERKERVREQEQIRIE